MVIINIIIIRFINNNIIYIIIYTFIESTNTT